MRIAAVATEKSPRFPLHKPLVCAASTLDLTGFKLKCSRISLECGRAENVPDRHVGTKLRIGISRTILSLIENLDLAATWEGRVTALTPLSSFRSDRPAFEVPQRRAGRRQPPDSSWHYVQVGELVNIQRFVLGITRLHLHEKNQGADAAPLATTSPNSAKSKAAAEFRRPPEASGGRRADARRGSVGTSPSLILGLSRLTAVLLFVLIFSLLPACVLAQPKPAPEKKPEAAAETEEAPTPPAELDDSEEFRQLPVLETKPLPTLERLLKGPAVDWLVLIRANKVIEIEPVKSRPDTLLKITEAVRKARQTPLPKVIGTDDSAREAEKIRRHGLTQLEIVLLKNGEDDGAYRINIIDVKQIVHYEDLMLQRVDLLLDAENAHDAFELLTAVQQRDPSWPGLADRRARLRFVEANHKLKQKLYEQALALFETVHQQNAEYPELERQLGATADALIQSAVQEQDFRRARSFLERLKNVYPNHQVAERWTQNLIGLATQELQTAVAAEKQSDGKNAIEHAELATRIWPDAQNVADGFRRIATRYQRLKVGTLDLAAGTAQTPVAVERERPLFAASLFEPARIGDKLVRYHSRFIQDWEPTELGRSILFRLRTQAAGWEGPDKVTAGPIVEEIAARLSPDHAEYNERFANYISGVRSLSPFEFSVEFRHAPLRPESLFDFAIPLSGSETSITANSITTARQRFTRDVVEPNRAVYHRVLAQPVSGKDWYLSELVERRYATPEALLQGWVRGEISMIPQVPLWDLERLRALPDLTVYEYALPLTHLIQFHPRNAALRNPSLRRALVYGSNRKKVLDEIVLRGKSTERGRLVSSPFATAQSAYNQLVPPHRFDARLAYSMMLAAKKELNGEIPKLRLGVSSDAVERSAALELAKQWQILGINVTVVEVGPQIPFNAMAEPAAWDLLYRTVRLTDPLTDLWPCLTLDNQARVESLTQLPDWLRHELIAADEAGDWPAAERELKQLHKDLWSEVYLIPLWEVSEFMAVRRNVRGLATRPMFAYQDVERWQVQPWFPK
jgi:tetratricopeptide (TPR) repeat protein